MMRKQSVLRKITAVFLAAALIALAAVPALADDYLEGEPDEIDTGMIPPGYYDPKDEGQCGDNVFYKFDNKTGVVRVYGTGETYGYPADPNVMSRIFNVNGKVYTLKIDSGVSAINEAFIPPASGKPVNVILPKSLKRIDSYNFWSQRPDYIFYEGTKSDWNKIKISSANIFDDVTILYKGEWFKDVSHGKDFFFKPVYWAVRSGITGGYGEGTFQPYFPCTRAMIVTFLYRRAGSPDVPGTNQFSDVKPTDWYYKPVSWAVKEGITSGYGVGTFQPEAPCTRAMIVTFLMRRYMKNAPTYEPVYKNIFPDVPKGAWYADAVMWAYDMAVTSGKGGYFKPNDVCTRGEAVSFISRTIE